MRILPKIYISLRKTVLSTLFHSTSVSGKMSSALTTDQENKCVLVKEEKLSGHKWLSLSQITYKDPTGKERTWEAVRRTTRRAGSTADCVCMIGVLKRTMHYDCLVFVKQYRPALNAYTIEMPAGLLDPGESCETSAVRELKEETGYTGTVKHVSPPTALDAGVGNMTVQFVTIEIDGDLPENEDPKPNLDPGEFIEVLTIPTDDLLQRLNDLAKSGCVIDSRVYGYAVGIEQTKKPKCSSLNA